MHLHRFAGLIVVSAFAGVAPSVRADLVYLTQNRSITAGTTADGTVLNDAAPDFGPFVRTLTSSTTFATATGPAINTGGTTIDCQLDPNAIRANGSLTGAGGLNIAGSLETGEASADVLVTFTLTQATPFSLFCSPRPSPDPRDEFQLEISNDTAGTEVIRLRRGDPAQLVNLDGTLQPGDYTFHFVVELTSEGPEQTQAFNLQFLVPSPGTGLLLGAAPLFLGRRRR